jgi:arylsulfatase A
MNRIVFLLAALCVSGVCGAEAARKPNIIYICLDDLGYYELSCLGHPEIRTPNIDRLAADGMRFTQMLAGGNVCAPTRSVLMTGQHLGRTTVRSNQGDASLRADDVTVAQVLKEAGYVTGGFGKWGLGDRGSTGVPEKHGFDVFFGYYHQVHAHSYYPRFLLRNSKLVEQPGNHDAYYEGETFSHYQIVAEARRFIRDNKDRPFFAYLAWTVPHGLWGFPKDDPAWALYEHKPWTAGQRSSDDAKVYAAMIHLADRQIGELRDLLNELGIADDTILIFSGDNGGQDYFKDAAHPDGFFSPNVDPRTGRRFRGEKGTLYEGGLRTPFIVCWPGKIASGRTNDHLGGFVDVLPTLAELAGAQMPANIDGLSLVPTLTGKGVQREHRYLYWEDGAARAVRAGDWKLVGTPPKWELYNLAKDPGERHDLATEQPERVATLAGYAAEAHQPQKHGQWLDRSQGFRQVKGHSSYVSASK